MPRGRAYGALVGALAIALALIGVPSWAALGAGVLVAIGGNEPVSPRGKAMTTLSLQLGVIALGAGMNLVTVAEVGARGALLTAVGIGAASVIGFGLARGLRLRGNTPLLITVGTAICGGSAIAAVTPVIGAEDHETSVALGVVFLLNAVGLVLFPLVGHALDLSPTVFGTWAALGIHDTSSVVGAGLVYGPAALAIATTTKLARALWIVPVTIVIALVTARREKTSARRWPWFILGFVALAALLTWVPALAPAAPFIVLGGQRALLVALFLIGTSLSRGTLARVGARPLVFGVLLWIAAASLSLWIASS